MQRRQVFEMIPKIYAGDLPDNVREELENWNDELCFHGDGGSVFRVRKGDLNELPLFLAWMIAIGAWSERQADLGDFGTFHQEFPDGNWSDYMNWLNGRADALAVAMTGT